MVPARYVALATLGSDANKDCFSKFFDGIDTLCGSLAIYRKIDLLCDFWARAGRLLDFAMNEVYSSSIEKSLRVIGSCKLSFII